jgi:CRISPR-associated protein Csm2
MSENYVRLHKMTDKVILDSNNYADIANVYMNNYFKTTNDNDLVTTTKLRKIYAQITNVYTRVTTPEQFEAAKGDIQYLKVKMAYEAGRESKVKTFLEKSRLFEILNSVTTFDKFQLYCRYAESVVAYFKYYGGRD